MTRKKTADANQPIVLSGVVFLEGILAEDSPQYRRPARVDIGDIKLHHVNKEGARSRFGQQINFAGFIVANIYDGKRFRKFLLRKRAAIESTHLGPVERRDRAQSVMAHMKTLVRRQAIWSVDGKGYEVGYNSPQTALPAPQKQEDKAPAVTPASVPSQVEAQPVAATVIAAPAVEPSQETVSVQVTVNVAVSAITTPAPSRRKRGKKVEDANQLKLFDKLP